MLVTQAKLDYMPGETAWMLCAFGFFPLHF